MFKGGGVWPHLMAVGICCVVSSSEACRRLKRFLKDGNLERGKRRRIIALSSFAEAWDDERDAIERSEV